MNNKYDWSNIPTHIDVITTNEDGKVWLWGEEVTAADFEPMDNGNWFMTDDAYFDEDRCICAESTELHDIEVKPYSGDWRDSLEQRPVQGGDL